MIGEVFEKVTVVWAMGQSPPHWGLVGIDDALVRLAGELGKSLAQPSWDFAIRERLLHVLQQLRHLRNLLAVKEAGATVLFLAPGFYHGAETVEELVDFIVGRALDQLGLDVELVKRWGTE